jgi:hypothetical protein
MKNSVLCLLSSTNLTTPGTYDFYKFSVSPADVIHFNALRMSDGVKVIGQIDAAGVLTIVDEEMNNEVTVLERIR